MSAILQNLEFSETLQLQVSERTGHSNHLASPSYASRRLYLCLLQHTILRKSNATMSDIIDVPVTIVGGGGCGLTLSSFLSDYGVDHVLFERHHSTSILPKAHYLNQRTMETFRRHGLAEEIMEKSCPPRHMSQVAWATSLGGTDRLDRKVIHKFGCFGGDDGGPRAETYRYCSRLERLFCFCTKRVTGATQRFCLPTCHYCD